MSGILSYELQLHVIRPTLQAIDLWSEAAENLLLGTAAQESHMGHYLTQVRGPALGIYQIEPATHHDVWDNFLKYHKPLADKVQQLLSPWNVADKDQALVNNLTYSSAIARIIYFRISKPLPAANDIAGLAAYWKQHYNTPRGKGKVEYFIKNYQELVL
jgi:hypothetical protein